MLEEVKGQMDERGNDMTDTSPLVKIKQGLSKLKVRHACYPNHAARAARLA